MPGSLRHAALRTAVTTGAYAGLAEVARLPTLAMGLASHGAVKTARRGQS
jgi:hypothetical protein